MGSITVDNGNEFQSCPLVDSATGWGEQFDYLMPREFVSHVRTNGLPKSSSALLKSCLGMGQHHGSR